jgi:hypothetical protein
LPGQRVITADENLVNRYYDPTTGQFLSVDPDSASTDQPYVFAQGDPVNMSDPGGLFEAGPNGQACIGPTNCNYASQATVTVEHDNLMLAEQPLDGPPAPVYFKSAPPQASTEPVPAPQAAQAPQAAIEHVQTSSGCYSLSFFVIPNAEPCWVPFSHPDSEPTVGAVNDDAGNTVTTGGFAAACWAGGRAGLVYGTDAGGPVGAATGAATGCLTLGVGEILGIKLYDAG